MLGDMGMPSGWLFGILRGVVQVLWASAAAWLVSKGIPVPDNAVVEALLFALAFGLVASGLRWLEARKSPALSWVGRILMLGLAGAQPVYVDPAAVVKVDGARVQ